MSTAPLTDGELAAIRKRFAHLGLSDLAFSELVADVVQRVWNHLEFGEWIDIADYDSDDPGWGYDGPSTAHWWDRVQNEPAA